jgi:hypothetical protein
MLQSVIKKTFDYKDGNLYWKHHDYFPKLIGKKAGSKQGKYFRVQFKGKTYLLHRLIFCMFNGYIPKQVDHIFGYSNDINNLRDANESTNQQNVGLIKRNKSGFKNVHWNKQNKKWIIQLHINKKIKHIGGFDDIELADLVATMAREKYHGQFANHGR